MMHDDQVDIDIDIARQMIRDQFPQYRHEDVTSVGSSGTVNAIFRIGSKSAARFPLRAMKPTECADMLRSEAAAMVEIGQHCLFPTPQPIGLGQPGPRYPMPWAVQTWIEGEVATPNGLSGSAIFALDLASLVASLRQADTRGRRFDGQGRGGHLPDHDDWMAVCFENSEGLLDVARLRDLWARLRELPAAEPVVMSHRDLIPQTFSCRASVLSACLIVAVSGRPIRRWIWRSRGIFSTASEGRPFGAAFKSRTSYGSAVLPGRSSRPWASSGITVAPTPP